jgi:hypothetical protein
MVNWGHSTCDQAGVTGENPSSGPAAGGAVLFLGAPFALDRAFGVSNITDGTSNSLLSSEVIVGAPNGSTDDHRGLPTWRALSTTTEGEVISSDSY